MFDLSIGGILALLRDHGRLAARSWPAAARAFLIGCGWGLLGVVNGVLVTRFRINALIATLATLSIYRAAAARLGRRRHQHRQRLTIFGQTKIRDLLALWFMAVIVLTLRLPGGPTRYFRQAYYIGGNAESGEALGINVDRTVFSFFAIMGRCRARRRSSPRG
jgi:ribose/xylose/arabinose/galactoside ABC-type transport system permease subunit